MAYKKMADMDEDRAKTYELEQVCTFFKNFLHAVMFYCILPELSVVHYGSSVLFRAVSN